MQIYDDTFWEARVALHSQDRFFYKQTNTKLSQCVDENPTVGFGYSITKNM